MEGGPDRVRARHASREPTWEVSICHREWGGASVCPSRALQGQYLREYEESQHQTSMQRYRERWGIGKCMRNPAAVCPSVTACEIAGLSVRHEHNMSHISTSIYRAWIGVPGTYVGSVRVVENAGGVRQRHVRPSR